MTLTSTPRHAELPPHALNVFVPLVELTEKRGPTEFALG